MEYKSKWKDQLEETANEILNRKKFSYDVNGDALYQQYKDFYTKQGKMASEDVMGQAASLTGGYGNSYAQTAANQAYQSSLDNLNSVIPELYQMAYDKYNQEGNDLYNKYSMLTALDEADYSRYRDTLPGDPPELPDSVKEKAASFEDNESLAAWAYGLEDSGVIAQGQAAQLISEFYDPNEKTVEVDSRRGGRKTSKISYREMVKSTNGWIVEDKGGGNFVGVDNNAKVKSPTGEILRLDQLVDKLINEGMSEKDAKATVKDLQNNLGIASNWFFGL